MPVSSPFHAGEVAVQERLGVRDIETWARRVVRPYMPEEHRLFHTALPFLVAAARDAHGRPWATLLTGPEGFVRSPDPQHLTVDARPAAGDGLEGALGPGVDVGLLGIELSTRRRNRVNGRLTASEGPLHFAVDQSFGNCPQYIHEREWERVLPVPGPPQRSDALSPAQQRLIEAADTFFIASGHRGEGEDPSFGMDASHRGGEPGFVRVPSARRLVFPDYAGNNHFNTIGNLLVDPRVGLLFVDFAAGSMLQLTGRATVDWDSPEVARHPGARRLVNVDIDAVIALPGVLPLRWSEAAGAVRSLRLVAKVPESADVTSFYFEARDGGALPRFRAGQHLPLSLPLADGTRLSRSYSLSGSPEDPRYRISVKRHPQGLVSRLLHDELEVGAVLDARPPAGDFFLPPCGDCPLVLISAGVGLTPMVSMLHDLAAEVGERPVRFLHGARDGAHHPLADEVRALASQRPNIEVHVSFSRPRPEDRAGVDYDSEGRIDAERVLGFLEGPEAHYFVCGPGAFMAEVQAALEGAGIASKHVHTESF